MNIVYKTDQKNISRVRRVPAVALACLVIAFVFQTSCKKLLEVDPPIDKIATTTVFSSTTYAVQAMTGIYADFINHFEDGYYLSDHSLRLAYTADELTPVGVRGGPAMDVYRDQYNTDPGGVNAGWIGWYTFIYRVNAILDGVKASTGIPQQSKTILNGEAKFMRAFCYFYLVNLYGDCPLITTSLYSNNLNVPRVSKDLVYAQIVQDLKDAQGSLTDNYLGTDLVTATTEKVRPNKTAATALLARVYLYMGNKWAEAETEATKVISNSNYSLLSDPNSVFLKNSGEAIWQLQPNPQGSSRYVTANTLLAAYLLPDQYATPQWKASDELLEAMEPGDLRQLDWLEYADDGSGTLYPVPYKYKLGKYQMDPEEYIMVLRLAEQYLIRAEARARQNHLTGTNSAESDVNAIRTRAGLASTTAGNDQPAMLAEIAKQRFAELFMEWGDRWLDLKRTGKINEVMSIECPLKNGNPVWNPTRALFAIPFSEFIYNPALDGHQNPGYPEVQ